MTEQIPFPVTPGGGISVPEYYMPTPSCRTAQQYYPGTEELGSEEMRITFMGSAPLPPRRNQSGMCVYVELGNGDAFFFDMGPGSAKNITGMQIPFAAVNDIFFTHLHSDHWIDMLYYYTFGPWYGRWMPLRIYGPSGRTKEDGTAYFAKKVEELVHWHADSFKICPVGRGYEIEAHEFDWEDEGGVAFEKNGARVIHWPASHSKDGASAYRLDWNGLSFVYTCDGRPNELTMKYGAGADIIVQEAQTEAFQIISKVYGMPEFLNKYTVDQYHTPGYAAGYIFKEANPRFGVVSHISYDANLLTELVAEVRTHWRGLFGIGAPDNVVINITKDAVWMRDGVISDMANPARPKFPPGGIVMPNPQNTREKIQEAWVRDLEIDPDKYYPEGLNRELAIDWPKDLKLGG